MSPEKKSKRQERREKMRSQAQRSRLLTVGLIVAGAALLVVMVVLLQNNSTKNIVSVTPANLPNASGLTIGDPNAKVTIDVFEDFQCPACQYYTESIEPIIIQNLVDTGKAKYTFHNFPFLDDLAVGTETVGSRGESDQAANASMCANEQGKFWDMHAIIYANWKGENEGYLNNTALKAMAEKIGLDTTSFNACFDASKYVKDVQADVDLGKQMGASGTPSVFVNGVKVGQPGKIATYQEIADAVNAAQ